MTPPAAGPGLLTGIFLAIAVGRARSITPRTHVIDHSLGSNTMTILALCSTDKLKLQPRLIMRGNAKEIEELIQNILFVYSYCKQKA